MKDNFMLKHFTPFVEQTYETDGLVAKIYSQKDTQVKTSCRHDTIIMLRIPTGRMNSKLLIQIEMHLSARLKEQNN